MRVSVRDRDLCRLVLARRDFREAKRYAEYVLRDIKLPNDDRMGPFACAAIISYSRPFKKSKGYPILPASYQSFSKKEFENLHREIIRLRDQCVAHSDEEVNKVVLILRSGSAPMLSNSAITSRGLNMRTFGVLKELCEYHLMNLEKDMSQVMAL